MRKKKKITVAEEEILGTDKNLILGEVKLKHKYMMDVAIYTDQKFVGSVIPIPDVLVKYLSSTELRIFTIILGQLKNHATSIIRQKSIAAELDVSLVTVSNVMANLEKMGIIIKTKNGRRMNKNINFDNIQYLNDLLDNRIPGTARVLRRLMKEKNIREIPEDILTLLDIKYSIKEGVEAEEYI